MLIAGERWLPQYKRAIAAAKRRARSGRRLPTREYRGAARLAAKSVEEMAKDRTSSTRLAGASEKAGADRPKPV
jgi:alpha-galactosidase